MSNNPVQLDGIGMKYMFLSIFAHDPWHDFSAGLRTDSTINTKIKELVGLLDDRPTIGGEKRKYSDIESSEIASTDNNTDIIEYKKQFVDDFVGSLTNEIFSDGLLYAIDLLENDELNPDIDAVSFDSLQENIINPAIKKLKHSEWSSLSVVHTIYKPELLPILEKSSITIDIVSKINEIEEKVKQNLYAIVLSEQSNDNTKYTCNSFWDLPDAITKINSYIEDNNSIESNIQITPLTDDILSHSNDEILSMLRSTKNKIIRPIHPDKDHTSGADERFRNIKGTIELIIDTCFTQENIENIHIEKKRKLGGNKKKPSQDKPLMKNVLVRIIKYFLTYTGSLQQTSEKGLYNTIPNFYLLNENEDKKTTSMKLLINSEILLLWITYKDVIFNATKTEILSEFTENFEKYYPHEIKDYFGILSDFDNWYSSDIDESSLDAIRVVVEEYYPENIVTKRDIDGLHNYIQNSEERFIVNNAASGLPKMNLEMNLEDYVYCPIVSIIDGMPKCKFKFTEDGNTIQNPAIISAMNLELAQLPEPELLELAQLPEPELYYNVKFIPKNPEFIKGKNNEEGKWRYTVTLYAYIGKSGSEDISGMPINHDLNLYDDKSDTRLSAKHSLRAIIDKMLEIYGKVSKQPLQLRSNISEKTTKYKNLFETVQTKIMDLSMMKSIGDWGQEIHVLTKNGGIDENSQSSEVRNINNSSDELRMGLSGDQISAARMIFMRLFADNINNDTIVGYQRMSPTKKNILISDKSLIDVLNRKQSINQHHSNKLKSTNQTKKNIPVKTKRPVKNITKKTKPNIPPPVETVDSKPPQPPQQSINETTKIMNTKYTDELKQKYNLDISEVRDYLRQPGSVYLHYLDEELADEVVARTLVIIFRFMGKDSNKDNVASYYNDNRVFYPFKTFIEDINQRNPDMNSHIVNIIAHYFKVVKAEQEQREQQKRLQQREQREQQKRLRLQQREQQKRLPSHRLQQQRLQQQRVQQLREQQQRTVNNLGALKRMKGSGKKKKTRKKKQISKKKQTKRNKK